MRTHLSFLLLVLALAGCVSNHPTCDSKVQPQPPCHTEKPVSLNMSDGKLLPFIAEMPKPGTKLKAAVVLVVGLDGTLCDYKSLTHALVQQGYAVYGCENRAGRYAPEENRRGSACNWHLFVEDLQNVTAKVRELHPKLPIYYHGHSLGAVVALETYAENRKNPKKFVVPMGLILQSPAYVLLPDKTNPLLSVLAWPARGLRINYLEWMGNSAPSLTGDEKWDCAWAKSTNRVSGGFTLGWFSQVFKMGHKARLESEKPEMPHVLALEGWKDRIALGVLNNTQDISEVQGEYEYYLNHQLAGGNAIVKSYRNGAHLLTEGAGNDKAQVIQDIIAWLDVQSR